MKKRLLWKIAILMIIFLVIFELIAGYLILNTLTSLNSKVQNSIDTLNHITIPVPKDGKNATMEQVNESVNSYLAQHPVKNGVDGSNATDTQVQSAVNAYMSSHPVSNGKDGTNAVNGTNGQNGLTPQIRCNAVKNRWEVRYLPTDIWQSLNGEDVQCTVIIK